jgi:hypothetical protein
MESLVVCVAKNQDEAHKIVNRLRAAGFSAKETSLLFAGSKELLKLASRQEIKQAEGAAAGLGAGAVAGGLTGLLLALTIFDAPEVGVLVALGPIVVHVADAIAGLAGSALGAIGGGLIGLRLPHQTARLYEAAVQKGNVLISVHIEDPARRAAARQIFEANGAEHISEIK